MKQNITISLERELIRRARVLAAQRDTSVSRLLADELTRVVEQAGRRESAKRQALADLDRGFRLGGRPASREELHER